MKLVDVAIPLPVRDPFTYRLPHALSGLIQVGCRLRVPFRNRTIIGYAVGLDSDKSVEQPKEVLEALDSQPILSDHQLRLAKWISEYYFSSWGEAISNMVPKWIKLCRLPQDSGIPSTKKINAEEPKPIDLNQEQETAFARLRSLIHENQFSEVYLFGVTGGGKTELYIRTIKEVLKRSKSAICLVPEIALTEQLKLFFVHHFHDTLEVLHSKLSDKNRAEAWHRIQCAEKRVVLGARSAVFAPTPQLGLIIMEEEQEGSYKQDQSPRYHAREVARWRAHDLGALFVTGTATPTVETMHRVATGEIEMLTLSKRVDGRPMPEVTVVDMKQSSGSVNRQSILSPCMRDAIDHTIASGHGVLLMLNRRGFSTHIRCLQCGNVLFCPQCAVALTFHQQDQQALCHYCNFHEEIPKLCRACHHPLLKFAGIGTEKVESEVARLFPKARIARLDTDSTRKKGSHEEILTRFRSHQIDILVGTQMIAKGFDFPHVTLVGIVNADIGLLLPDFRSAERTFQLLTQMAGRTGRGQEGGRVLIQTYSPNHYSIRFAVKHDYLGFFSEEIKSRKELGYPPFTKLINLILRGKNEGRVREQSFELRRRVEEEVKKMDHAELIGPAPLPLYRLRGHYRWHLMIKGAQADSIRKTLRLALESFKRRVGVHVAVDVDPVAIL